MRGKGLNLFIDGVVFRSHGIGGVSKYWSHLLQSMVRHHTGMKIYFLDINSTNPKIADIQSHNPESFYILQQFIQSPRRFFLYNKYNARDMYMMWYSFKYPTEIYHGTYYSLPPWSTGKEIITVYDMIQELFPQNFGKTVQKFIQIKKTSLERADGIIAISNNTKNDLLSIYPQLAKKPIAVTHLGADHDVFTTRKVYTEIKGVESLNSRPFLIFLGERDGYKNFNLFLKAFHKSPLYQSHKIIIVGGKPNFTDEEQRLITSSKLSSSIIKLNFISDEELAGLYCRADALVYPSQYEGFGLPIIEAFACGCPVVMMKTSSMVEIAKSSGIFFEEPTVESLTDALERIEKYSKDVETSPNLQNTAKSYNWDITAKMTVDFYNQVLQL